MSAAKIRAAIFHIVLAIVLAAGALMSAADGSIRDDTGSDWSSSWDSGGWWLDSGTWESDWSSSDGGWDGGSDSSSWDSWDSGSDSGSWDSDW